MAKIVLENTAGGYNIAGINRNFTKIQEALQNSVLYRTNPSGEPNVMNNDLDMNSKRIYNLPAPIALNEPARLGDVISIGGGAVPASFIPFTPYKNITSLNVQGAIQEVKDDVDVADAKAGAAQTSATAANIAAVSASAAAANALTAANTASTGVSTVNTALNNYKVLVGGSAGASQVGYAFPYSGGVLRTQADKNKDYVNVKDFGAVGDGVTDDFTAIQRALTYIKSLPYGGTLYVPTGRYLLNTRLQYSDNNLEIVGDGEFSTYFLVNNSNGFIEFASVGPNNTFSTKFSIREFGIIPVKAGTCGTAVNAYWAYTAWNTATPHFTAFKITVRSMNYTSDGAYFTNHFSLTDAAGAIFSHVYGWDYGLDGSFVRINNSTGTPSFGTYFNNVNFNHGNGTSSRGIYCTGWFEDINIVQSSINGQWKCIELDANGSAITNPNITIMDLTGNAKSYGIDIYKCASIKLVNVDMFHGPVESDPDRNGGSVRMTNCKRVQVDNCKLLGLGAIQGGWATHPTDNGLTFSSCQYVNVANTQVINHYNNGIQIINDCLDFSFSNCSVFSDDGLTNGTGVFLQNPGYQAFIQFNEMKFNNLTSGYVNTDIGGVYHNNDFFTNVATSYVFTGSIRANPVLINNTNPSPLISQRVVFSGATPIVRGLSNGKANVTNASATTITNFLGGVEGQIIDLYFSNGNTTVSHNSSIFLQGSTSFNFAGATTLRLQLIGSVWFEQGRRT